MISFSATIAEFRNALSWMPRTSTHVISATIVKAGRLNTIGRPPIRGALRYA